MEWWQWIVFGTFILCAEAIVDSEFYLVFLGLSAIVVGIQDSSPIRLPPAGQWLLFSALAVASIVLFRQRVYERIRGDTPDLDEGVDGEIAIACERILPGEIGLVELRGARWSACNGDESPISDSSRVRVESSRGLTLVVRAEAKTLN